MSGSRLNSKGTASFELLHKGVKTASISGIGENRPPLAGSNWATNANSAPKLETMLGDAVLNPDR
jgi:hypothetical protein